MPANTRNFWLHADVDGRGSSLSGGPVARDGGFDQSIAQRADGCVTYPVSITGRNLSTGQNIMEIDVRSTGGSHVEVYRGGKWVKVRSNVSVRIVSER